MDSLYFLKPQSLEKWEFNVFFFNGSFYFSFSARAVPKLHEKTRTKRPDPFKRPFYFRSASFYQIWKIFAMGGLPFFKKFSSGKKEKRFIG